MIRHVASESEDTKRDADILARLGGEEFVLLLPGTRADDAFALAEEVRRRIESAPLAIDNAVLRITASIGVAEAAPPMTRLSDLMKHADNALYEAKRAGRNRVRLGQPPAEAPLLHARAATSAA